MKINVFDTYEQMSAYAAQVIKEEINKKKNLNLGLATGSTPEGMYENLVEFFENDELDFSSVTTFNLDEYCGLTPSHSQSYHYFMDEHLLSKVNVKKENINIPEGDEEKHEDICKAYDKKISQAGGIDLQVLGIGVNGHIGFNEPGDIFVADTHLIDLTDTTIEQNSRFFSNGEEVPKKAITMGIRPIINANKVVLMANGPSKAHAIKISLEGPITPQVPASILQLHEDLIVILDKEAAAELESI